MQCHPLNQPVHIMDRARRVDPLLFGDVANGENVLLSFEDDVRCVDGTHSVFGLAIEGFVPRVRRSPRTSAAGALSESMFWLPGEVWTRSRCRCRES